jgi:phage terminase large subunit-like protein
LTEVKKAVLGYCEDILSKKIPSCVYTQKAVKRFLNDLKNEKTDDFEYYMDWPLVQKFYDFTKRLKLVREKKYLGLLPWQLFVHANLLGWKDKHDAEKSRFRSGAVFVPRKNGKTTGIMYPLLLWDFLTTDSSEAYFFEKDERQAEKMFRDLKAICKNSEGLGSIVGDTGTNIYYKNSKVSYFSSETAGIDGYNPSIAVVDEYFCFQSDRPITAMRYGSRARKNGLVLVITTAGTDVSLPAYNEEEKVKKVLNGVLTDDTYFGILYGIDDDDDWKNSKSYVKANPSIDAIIDRKTLEQDMRDAMSQPSRQADYKAKTLNVWTNDSTNWIHLQKWDTAKRNATASVSDFEGQRCYAALDLSSINDFTAYTLCFERGGSFYLFHKFYVPSEQVLEKYRVENINIREWVGSGTVTAIPGPTIDYAFVQNDLCRDAERFDVAEVAYDRWQSNKLVDSLEEEIPRTVLVRFDQSLKQMSGPSKEFERLVLEDKIVDPNPVMKWMVGNAVVRPDVNGNFKPLKEYKSSTKRIDGVITSIMALSRCRENANTPSSSFDDVLKLF